MPAVASVADISGMLGTLEVRVEDGRVRGRVR